METFANLDFQSMKTFANLDLNTFVIRTLNHLTLQ